MTNSIHRDALNILLGQDDMSRSYLNWFQDGGAEIIRINYDWWVLFEIPLYGGEPRYMGTYHRNKLNDLIKEVFSWT